MNLQEFKKGKYLVVSNREIYVRTIGSGPVLVILHGGPGLEHSYMYKWLLPLASRFTLVFYDQIGCGKDKTIQSEINIKNTIAQFKDLILGLEITEFDCLTHSWGSFILLSSLPIVSVNRVILANPIGLTYERFEESGERLMDRVPENIQTKVGKLMENINNINPVEIMEIMLPYYISQKAKMPNIIFDSYNIGTFDIIAEQLEGYNIINNVINIPRSTLLIYGDDDFENQSGSCELKPYADKQVNIPNVGHFSFAENNKIFIDSVENFLML